VYASHSRPTIVLNYAFEPVVNDGKLVMSILLEFQGGPIETADLVVPTTWGDAKDLGKGIANLKNVHESGHLRISYDLVKDWVVAGEVVTLNGNLHVLISTTVNGNHISSDMHFQPQGLSGVGSVSGNKYQATGITRFSFEADVVGFPFTETLVNNFKIIGQGPGNNFLVHENFHLTGKADGPVTANIDNFSAECK